MRKLTFVLILVTLLVISTAVVYAGWEWGGDPHIGHGIWLSWTVTADGPADDWPPDVHYKARVKNHHGELKAEATVWIAHYEEEEEEEEEEDHCTLSVALTRGEHGPVLATESGSCGHEVKVKWKSDEESDSG